MNKHKITRRQWIGGMGAMALLSRFGSFNALAQTSNSPSDYKALVCILLAGGNDGHNTLVPQEYQPFLDYKKARGALALPDNNGPLLQIQTRQNGTRYGLNPGLTHIHNLWTSANGGAGQLAVLANVGMLVKPITRQQYLTPSLGVPVPTNLFSHADQILQMQAGIANASITGWGGRAADQVQGLNYPGFPTAMSLSGPSLFCTGAEISSTSLFPGFNCDVDGMNLWPASAATARANGYQQILELDSGLKLIQAANQSRKDARDLNALLTGNPAKINTPFPATPIGAQLKQVAQTIKAGAQIGMRRQVFFCTMGGFDTHAGQSWQHWNLLYDLSEAMARFYDATVNDLQMPDKITTFTLSDFGRTLQPSGDGCDHGWGNHHLIMGGAVKGGDVYGTFPSHALGTDDDSGNRGALIPTTSISQYGATLARWFGVADGAPMKKVFGDSFYADFPVTDLGFMS
jgi:uncharacterized protein (DUF1501 family)